MTGRQELMHIAQMRWFYDSDRVRQWIAKAEAGKLQTRDGQLDRWKATVEYLEETQDVPLEEMLYDLGVEWCAADGGAGAWHALDTVSDGH